MNEQLHSSTKRMLQEAGIEPAKLIGVETPAEERRLSAPRRESDRHKIAKLEQQSLRWAQDGSRIERLEAVNAQLLDACKWTFQALTDGVLVRDISHDAERDWAMKMVQFVGQLSKLRTAIKAAEEAL